MSKLTWDQADFQACLSKSRADAATLRVQLLAAGKAVPSEPQLSGDLFEDVEALEMHVAVLRATLKIGPAMTAPTTTTPQPIVTQPTAPKMMTPPIPQKPMTLTEQCMAANARKAGAK